MNGVKKHAFLHRLVAKEFVQNPNNKQWVNHIDGNKLNNLPSNLEWVTSKENSQHAIRTGLIKSGTNSVKAKMNEEQLKKFFEISESGEWLNSEIAKEFNITQTLVGYIQKGKHYANIFDGKPINAIKNHKKKVLEAHPYAYCTKNNGKYSVYVLDVDKAIGVASTSRVAWFVAHLYCINSPRLKEFQTPC